LEGDRGLALLRQAHVEGKIDLSLADPLDRNWWRKVRWTIGWLEKENLNRVSQLRYQLSCALLAHSKNNRGIRKQWDTAVKLQNLMARRLFPWRGQQLELGTSTDQIRRLDEMWREIWGNPEDPETAKAIEETVRSLNKMVA